MNHHNTITNCKADVEVSGSDAYALFGRIDPAKNTISSCYYRGEEQTSFKNRTVTTRIYKLTIPDDLTASGNFVEFGGNTYATAGTTVTLTVKSDNSFHKVTGISGTTQNGDNYSCTIAGDVEFKLEGYPKIGNLAFDGENTYSISDEEGFRAFAAFVNAGNSCAGMKFKLTNEITLNGTWNPIGNVNNKFSGEFDGGNFTIIGLTINTSGIYQGLFGYIDGATVQNVNLAGVDITANDYAGAIAGYAENNSKISNCHASGTIKAYNYDIAGNYHGGLVGVLEISTIDGCTFAGTVDGTKTGYDAANSQGGIVGLANYSAVIKNSVFIGGEVKGGSYLGAVAGDVYSNTTFTDNYYYGTFGAGVGTEGGTQVYKVTLPSGIDITGGIYVTDGDKTYATGEITLSGTKTGYSVQNSANITADTTINLTLDDTNHYIFGTEGNYTLADDQNIVTNNYPNLTQVYKITLPEGVTVTSDKYEVGNDTYVAVNAQVTIAATDANKLIKSATVEGGTLTNGVYTLTAMKDLTVTDATLIWDFAKVFTDADGTSDKSYTLDTVTKLGYLTDNVAVGEDYSGKYFSLTSGIGSEVQNIGDATNQFKGTATFGAGVKVSFNGGATIEAVSGEISFNASTSTFDSLDSDDKFKVGDTEYTVGENFILQSGKVWLNPANVTLTELNAENNWTTTVDGTITLTDAATQDFYGTDGKKVASFNGSTLTKANDSSTTITAINASALTSPITIDGFYNENTTITAGTGGVNVNIGDNKFSVVSGAFVFDGSKLISGTAQLSTANDAVKVGGNLITLTSGDGITVNAADSTLGSLNSGDKFKIGNDNYEVTANGIIKNNNALHATADTLAINDTSWKSATIITDDAITLESDTLYIDSTAKQIAELKNGTLTALDTTDAKKLTVDVGTSKEYTLGTAFSNLKSGNNSFKVTASGDYKVNGTTITLANVTGIEIDGVTYSIDDKISKTVSGNTYHLTKSETVTTSALTSGTDWKLYSGTVTVTDSLTTTNGKTLKVADDSDGVTVTVENGAIKSITGLASGGSVTYGGKTYKHTLTLPSGATATGDKLVIDGKDYYATVTTVTVSGFTSGEISFDSSITSLEKSGDSIVAKVGEDVVLTISGLTYPTENGNDWTVSGNSANYLKKITAGATIFDKKITYQPANTEILFTLSGLKSNVPVDEVKSAIEVGDGEKITITNSVVLEDGATISAGSYTVKLATSLAPSNSVNAGWNGTSYYSTAGYKTGGWTLTNGKVTQVSATNPAFEISGLNGTPNATNITVGNNELTINDAALLKAGNTISAGSYTVKLASGLAPSNSVSVGWNGTSYYSTAGYKTGGWSLSNGKVTQVPATNPTVTVTGLKSGVTLSDSNISVANGKVTIKDAGLLTNGTSISADNNYTVELASGLAPSNSVNVGWNGTSYYSTAGYKTAVGLSATEKSLKYRRQLR